MRYRCACQDAFRVLLGGVVWFVVVLMVTDQCRGIRNRGNANNDYYYFQDFDLSIMSSSSSSLSPQYENEDFEQQYQPVVTTIEGDPGQMSFASLSFPNGSVWCKGARTYWLVGRRKLHERPWCQVSQTSLVASADGNGEAVWEPSLTTILDTVDEQNGNDLERHYCSALDVNRDGLPDIVCLIGASRGTGEGFNELYFTQANGTLMKVQRDHGLQTYPTMRTRYSAVLKNNLGEKEFLFIATIGANRTEGLPNVPRMFRNDYTSQEVLPYFHEVAGPWTSFMLDANCAVTGDFTGDQRDDLVVCNRQGPPLLVQQTNDSSFRQVNIPAPNAHDRKKKMKYRYMTRWRNVRIADVNGDGKPDLIVVTFGQPSNLYVFRGQEGEPYFDFDTIYFRIKLPFASSDVEVLDVNRDKMPDIYVVQVDETGNSSYCKRGRGVHGWWSSESSQPPANWSPPLDQAPDVLLVNVLLDKNTSTEKKQQQDSKMNGKPFLPVTLNHSRPGCGWIAHRFDDQTMLLGQGNQDKVGHSLLLEWK